MAASKEIVGSYSYTKDDGTVTKGSKTFKDCDSSLVKTEAAQGLKAYSKVVDGTLTAGQFKTVEDMDLD